jgi:hypothetical protein
VVTIEKKKLFAQKQILRKRASEMKIEKVNERLYERERESERVRE